MCQCVLYLVLSVCLCVCVAGVYNSRFLLRCPPAESKDVHAECGGKRERHPVTVPSESSRS